MPCDCERFSDQERIKCIVKEFDILMTIRGRPLNKKQKGQLLETDRLANLQLFSCNVSSITEELVESQILYTFLQKYIKLHPRLPYDCPDIGNLKVKTSFFEST
ncbi:OrNV gp094-like protein [Tomelloso virus]|uniref:OrNV gp094-like protein n=1 Tax=Tomelloso virus TaxID=2053981 RepID=A0A2H4T2W0_9VIRU|nr:OrNV gp094-like protein [Tomelloso virus]ATY70263.1 OrNV gp094-like protein [Tomelloso virus]